MEIYYIVILALNTLLIIFLLLRRGGAKELSSEAASDAIEKFAGTLRDEFSQSREEMRVNSKELREELGNLFRNFGESIARSSSEMAVSQKTRFDDMENRQNKMKVETEILLEKVRETVEKKLDSINQENSKKLEEMRKTVDEKLHETLEKRLSESFKQVSERLKQVHEGLGEMKNLAVGVGDLKKVLSNVKSRGVLGEMQLEAILENLLSPTQYDKNVSVKHGSRESVEFAIRFPGRDDSGLPVYMPVDSKFPVERYYKLIEAYESGSPETIACEIKNLETEIKRCAREISEKYINPPETTDFAIMFLPFEGLYAEVIRNTALVETVQREYKVSITGPSTLAAFLNSIQMGFRTLAIQQRTTEVWKILGAVKSEFKKFGETLEKARDKISKAGDDIDELVGKRTRKIQFKLKSVEELPEHSASAYIDDSTET